MESLIWKVGIYSHCGQLYEPNVRGDLLYYKESRDGQILRRELPRPEHFPHGLRLEPLKATTGFQDFRNRQHSIESRTETGEIQDDAAASK
jgi:pyruvate dehydrogenase E1 component